MNQSSRETVGTNVECPISRLLEIISAKWTVEILREISIAPTRTRQFLRLIPGLSMKSLQFRLKELEKFGLLERIEYDQLPRHVEHSITERGKKAIAIYMSIKELAEEVFPVACDCPMGQIDAQQGCSDAVCPNRPVDRF